LNSHYENNGAEKNNQRCRNDTLLLSLFHKSNIIVNLKAIVK
jgi:hypothetical protein